MNYATKKQKEGFICRMCKDPEQVHYAHGLCRNDYFREKRKQSPSKKEKYRMGIRSNPVSFVYAFPGVVSPLEKDRQRRRAYDSTPERKAYMRKWYQENKQKVKENRIYNQNLKLKKSAA